MPIARLEIAEQHPVLSRIPGARAAAGCGLAVHAIGEEVFRASPVSFRDDASASQLFMRCCCASGVPCAGCCAWEAGEPGPRTTMTARATRDVDVRIAAPPLPIRRQRRLAPGVPQNASRLQARPAAGGAAYDRPSGPVREELRGRASRKLAGSAGRAVPGAAPVLGCLLELYRTLSIKYATLPGSQTGAHRLRSPAPPHNARHSAPRH